MQLAEFRVHVRDRVDDARGLLAKDPTVNLWLNLAVRSIWRYFPWPFTKKQGTVNTVANTATVSLPSDCAVPVKVVDATNDSVLLWKPDRWLQDWYTDDSGRGKPIYYTEGGLVQAAQTAPPVRALRLYPTPDAAYTLTVTYKKTATEMTDDGHYSPLPEDFDEAIMQWVLVRFFRKVDDFQAAAEAAGELAQELQRLIETYAATSHEHFPRIPITELDA